MDPYLEHPALWPDVHNPLIAELRNTIAPVLRPRYSVRLEERTYLAEPEGLVSSVVPPWPSSEERPPSSPPPRAALPREAASSWRCPCPTPCEKPISRSAPSKAGTSSRCWRCSPTNKAPGRGREIYANKRRAVLSTRISLVEIDLVRAGEPMAILGTPPRSHYRILVSPGSRRPIAQLFPFALREPIPVFCLPLRSDDAEPSVDVGAVLATLYDHAAYDLSVDYRRAPTPPLEGADAEWADTLLRRAGVR
jgi:hypothetical protein